jgi:hypothetical protein
MVPTDPIVFAIHKLSNKTFPNSVGTIPYLKVPYQSTGFSLFYFIAIKVPYRSLSFQIFYFFTNNCNDTGTYLLEIDKN